MADRLNLEHDDYIRELSKHLDVTLNDNMRHPLAVYATTVKQWGRKINLTGTLETKSLLEILFADAMILSQMDTIKCAKRLIDVGAGAGAPTLPLLVMQDALSADLVEPQSKRVSFMNTAIGLLHLPGRAHVYAHRIDTFQKSHPYPDYDVALSRATFAITEWISIGCKLAKNVLCFSTDDSLLDTLGENYQIVETRSYTLPWSNTSRCLSILSADASNSNEHHLAPE